MEPCTPLTYSPLPTCSGTPCHAACSLTTGPREQIAALDHPGRPVLACSASGRSISAVWPSARAYAVYTLAPTGSWEVVDRGSANNVVWCSTAPMYAVISGAAAPASSLLADGICDESYAAVRVGLPGLVLGGLNVLAMAIVGSRSAVHTDP